MVKADISRIISPPPWRKKRLICTAAALSSENASGDAMRNRGITHHEIEWFFATTLGGNRNTTFGDFPSHFFPVKSRKRSDPIRGLRAFRILACAMPEESQSRAGQTGRR